MAIQITKNYYFAGSAAQEYTPLATPPNGSSENNPPNLKNWNIANETNAANKVASDEVQNPRKSNLKRYLMIAAWIIGMAAGLTLGILGIVYNPLLTEVGALVLTAFSGMGAKVIECILSHKDYRD